MKLVRPEVFLVQKPSIVWPEVERYLAEVGGTAWLERVYPLVCATDVQQPDGTLHGVLDDGEALVEFMGRLCYRSWVKGINKNVTRVRTDSAEYMANVLQSLHGSVLEHANYSFVFRNVSRVETHEHVRHRAGVAISQESMRYVRLDDIGMWIPEWAQRDFQLMVSIADDEVCGTCNLPHGVVPRLEQFQRWMAQHFGLDDEGVPFSEKKHKTSFMRRFAPHGVATELGWTANIRTLRWVLQQRTEVGAEEEIRLVFQMVGRKMKEVCPTLFDDFEEDKQGQWVPMFRKV